MFSIACGESDLDHLGLIREVMDCILAKDEPTYLLPDIEGTIVSITYYKVANIRTGIFQFSNNEWRELTDPTAWNIYSSVWGNRCKLDPRVPGVPAVPESPIVSVSGEDNKGWRPIFFKKAYTP